MAIAYVNQATEEYFAGTGQALAALTLASAANTILIPNGGVDASEDWSASSTGFTQDAVTASSSAGVSVLRKHVFGSTSLSQDVDLVNPAGVADGIILPMEFSGLADAAPVAVNYGAATSTTPEVVTDSLPSGDYLVLVNLLVVPTGSGMGFGTPSGYTNRRNIDNNGAWNGSMAMRIATLSGVQTITWSEMTGAAPWWATAVVYAAADVVASAAGRNIPLLGVG